MKNFRKIFVAALFFAMIGIVSILNVPQAKADSSPSITVLSPNGVETWSKGSAQTIIWNTTGNISNVSILLVPVNDSVHARTFAANVANTGSYSWTIPNCTVNVPCSSNFEISTGSYYIRVYDSINNVVDESNVPFSIVSAIIASDSDNSTDYNKTIISYLITPEKYPDLFTAGVGTGFYRGSPTYHLIYGLEPNSLTPKPTDKPYSTYYDHCVNYSQLGEAFVTSDGQLSSVSVSAPTGYICSRGAFITTPAAPDTQAPTIPANLTAVAISSFQINLSWTASTDDVGVTGYKIYRCFSSTCAPTTQIAISATNSYSNTGLTASTAYTYAVSAYDAAGNESVKSPLVSATTSTPSITVLSPNGWETYKIGDTINIRWSSKGLGTDINAITIGINLMDQNGNIIIRNFSQGEPNTGSFSWTIQNSSEVTEFIVKPGQYRIGLYSSRGIFGVHDESDAPFSIVTATNQNQPPVISGVSGPQSLNVNQQGTWTVKASSPNGGNLSYHADWGEGSENPQASLNSRTQQSVTFTHSYSRAGIRTVTFEVTNSSGQTAQTSVSVKVGGMENVVSYEVSPQHVIRGETYTFSTKISSVSKNSPVFFYLQRPDGSYMYNGFNLGYTDGVGKFSRTITRKINITGQNGTWVSWVRTGGIDSGKIYHNVTPSSIASPSITVLSPNGGEQWQRGKSYEIKWNNTTSKNVYVRVLKGNTYITESVAYSSSQTSVVVQVGDWPLGSDYKVWVTNTEIGAGNMGDMSDAPFSIVAPDLSIISEQVKCVFNGSQTEQKCYAASHEENDNNSCSGKESCSVDIKRAKGESVIWKSTCGGYAYTTMDGQNESAEFNCATFVVPPPQPGATPTNPPQPIESDIKIIDMKYNAKNIFNDKYDAILSELRQLRDTVKEQQNEIKYLRAMADDLRNISDKMKSAINDFITYGVDANTVKLGAGERAAVINSYKSAFDKLPETEAELTDAIKIANGRFPSLISDKAEKEAIDKFIKIYKRMPDLNDSKDNAAIKVMAYGLRQKAENRNLNSEKAGIKIFRNIYGRMPKTTADWNIMQAITYSGAAR